MDIRSDGNLLDPRNLGSSGFSQYPYPHGSDLPSSKDRKGKIYVDLFQQFQGVTNALMNPAILRMRL